MTIEDIHITYNQTGASQQANDNGMRVMQARAFEKREAQYLLIKSPPASGKSRALMFIALDKLHRQGVEKAIICVPEKSIGKSFGDTDLSAHGFFADWRVHSEFNLCVQGAESGALAKSKVRAFKRFMEQGTERTLVCTHATFRFAFDALGPAAFDGCLVAIDEFHHVSSNEENRLGECLRALLAHDRAHIVAMTGSYFRGDTEPVLHADDEERFEVVTYTYYEPLNGYRHLQTLGIGFHFHQGRYLDALHEVLDPALKTIIHIPNVNSYASTQNKYEEVNAILDLLGTYEGTDPQTGFQRVRTAAGQVLRVADLVSDDARRLNVAAALEDTSDRDKVDIIIALGMAKEGFDWPWCEHALTIGFRSSMTEIIQIVGRATRDAPGKGHAQFTNLLAEPEATQDDVTDGVNAMLKAIAASLLMEQVLAPKLNFVPRASFDLRRAEMMADGALREEPGGFINEDGTGGTMVVKGLAEPNSPKCQKVIDEQMPDLMAELYQDKDLLAAAALDKTQNAGNVIRDYGMRAVARRNPDLDIEGQEIVAQHLLANLVLPVMARERAGAEGKNMGIVEMLNRFVIVDEIDMDMIASINPFQQAYEIIAKTVDKDLLEKVQKQVAAKKMKFDEADVVNYWPRIIEFQSKYGRAPNLNSGDQVEAFLGQIFNHVETEHRARTRRQKQEAQGHG